MSIRKYLGWPSYAAFDTALESTMDLVGGDADAAAAVRAVLANLTSIETEIAGLHGIALADKVEESALNPDRYRDLRAAGRREVRQLSILLNASVRRDAFGTGWSGGLMALG